MKKTIYKILMIGLLINLWLPVGIVLAQNTTTNIEYSVLTPLPGTGIPDNCKVGENCKTTLEKYLPGMFNLLIGVSAAFAVLMIVFGGLKYISTDALQKKEDGKKMIENSIYGLFLVVGAWLILFTINPQLLTLRLGIDPAIVPIPSGGMGGSITGTTAPPMTDAEVSASNIIRATLEGNGIGTYQGPCTYGGPLPLTGCVNLNGLTNNTISGVTALRNDFGKYINITGGTEAGHSAGGGHSDGSSLDFGQGANQNYSDLTRYIQNKDSSPVQTSYGPLYTFTLNGKQVTALHESSPEHWHITFK